MKRILILLLLCFLWGLCNADRGALRIGNTLSPARFTFTADASDNDVEMTLRGNNGDKVLINWGDGNYEQFTMTGSNVVCNHTYSTYADYTVQIVDYLNVTSFRAIAQSNVIW